MVNHLKMQLNLDSLKDPDGRKKTINKVGLRPFRCLLIIHVDIVYIGLDQNDSRLYFIVLMMLKRDGNVNSVSP